MMIAVRVTLQGILSTTVRREFPEMPVVIQTCMGSFDCVGVRFAIANFAQDDKM